MRGFLALIKRELRSILREKTIMFAIMVQFCIAAFSSVILVGIMAFYDPSSIGDTTDIKVRAGIVYDAARDSHNPEMSALMRYLSEGGVRWFAYYEREGAEDAFKRGRIDTIISMSRSADGVVDMQLVMPELDTKKTIVFMVLDEPLKKFENHLRLEQGVELMYPNLGGESSTTYEFLFSLVVPILMLFPALIAGSIVIDSISEEFENKTFDTLAAAPVSLFQVVSSKVGAAVLTAAVQIGMWIGLLRLNDIRVENAGMVAGLGIAIALGISAVTAFISMYFKDRERTQFVYSISLVVLIAGSYFLDPSPFGLITRLASGSPGAGVLQVVLYAVPLVLAGWLLVGLSRRLVLVRK